MSSVPWIEKAPDEEFDRGFDFAEALSTGETVQAGTAAAYEMDTGTDVTGDLLASATVTPVGTAAGVHIIGGDPNVDYEIRILMPTSTGQVLREKIVVQVRDSLASLLGGGGLGGGGGIHLV